MSNQPAKPMDEVAEIAKHVPQPSQAALDGVDVRGGEGYSEKLVDAIEMIGEERAAGFGTHGPSAVTPGMRYLHSSRTIHQLVTDRNRAVGIYLAVASLLVTASSAILHANPKGDLILPLTQIQRWCLPLTFATLTILSVLIGFLLIRTRVGLIYEVAKMNALLGLPPGRVSRNSPLSIFFITQVIVSLGGGLSAGLLAAFLLAVADPDIQHVALPAVLIGAAVTAALLVLYLATVAYVTSDRRLQELGAK